MDEIREALKLLKGTSIADSLRRMDAFYNEVERSIEPFSERYGVSCPDGCGRCCIRFLPDITKLESVYLSAYIMFSGKKEEILKRLEDSQNRKNGPCPLFDETKEFHCMCYRARPLICRLFAQSCFPGKRGEKKFSKCHLSPEFRGPDIIEDPDAPIMGSFGQKMLNLEDNDSLTEFLPVRVKKDILLMEYYLQLEKGR